MRETSRGISCYSRFRIFLLSSSSTAGLWLSLLRKNTKIMFCTMVAAWKFCPGLCSERCLAYTPEVQDHLPKGRKEWTTRASCWQNQVRVPCGRESQSTEPVLRKSLLYSTSSPAPCPVCTLHPATCMLKQGRDSFRKIFFLLTSLGRSRQHHCWGSGFWLQPCPQILASRHQLHPSSSGPGNQPKNTASCPPG